MDTNFSLEDMQSDQWTPKERAVVSYIVRDKDILLIHKKTGLGKGLVNAPGGRIEQGESPEEAAIRETREEVGLSIGNLNHRGRLFFQFIDGYSLSVEIFMTGDFSGIPCETGEADPFWCSIEDIPYDKMWQDDKLWIPLMLEETFFTGYFIFNKEIMLDYQLVVKGEANELDSKNK